MASLHIPFRVLDEVIRHCLYEHPREACGVISGVDDPLTVHPIHNRDRSETSYRFDEEQQLRVWKEIDHRGERPLVIYHSHTHSDAFPSTTDTAGATYEVTYLIVSTKNPLNPQIKAWSLTNMKPVEQEIWI